MLGTQLLPNRHLAFDLFDEMDRVLNDWSRATASSMDRPRNFEPLCDISETDEHYLMSVDLPGMKKEDIKIEAIDNVLTLSGERKREYSDTSGKIQRYEKSYGTFQRRFALPTSVEASKVEARYEDGVLELYLPKSEAAKPRQIDIKTGKIGIFDKLLGSKNSNRDLKEVSSNKAN